MKTQNSCFAENVSIGSKWDLIIHTAFAETKTGFSSYVYKRRKRKK